MYRKITSLGLIPMLITLLYALPAHATVTTFSNGVQLYENYTASGSNAKSFTILYNGESMDLYVQSGNMSQSVTIDGQLTIDYQFAYNQSNELYVYSGTVAGPYGTQTIYFEDTTYCEFPPQEPGSPPQPGECFLTNEAASWSTTVGSTVAGLHSESFFNALQEAQNEAHASGWIGCGLAAIGLALSYAGLWTGCTVGIVTVMGCVGAIAAHAVAVASYACACHGEC